VTYRQSVEWGGGEWSAPHPDRFIPRRHSLEASWNAMTHAQKPNVVFRRNGRVHLNLRGRQFSRLLAAEVCASAVVMLDTPCSEVVWRVLVTHSIRQFPLHFLSRASSHFNWSLPVIQEAGWPAGLVWTGEGKREFLDTVWVLFPSPRVSSESLCRLSYLGPLFYSEYWIDCRKISEFREVVRFGEWE